MTQETEKRTLKIECEGCPAIGNQETMTKMEEGYLCAKCAKSHIKSLKVGAA